MLLIIPLGGLGERFSKLGYNKPKPLINVFGKPILFWLLDNLDLSLVSKVIIPYHHSLIKYNFEDLIKKHFYKTQFIFIPLLKNTLGASDTILKALNILEENNYHDEEIISLDGDNFYTEINILKLWKQQDNKNNILIFKDENSSPIYSYVKFNNNKITEIKEKIKISDYACSGGYGFSSWKQLKQYCNNSLQNKLLNPENNDELYTSKIIHQMILDNIDFGVIEINVNNFICLGTPLQVRLFCNNFPKYEALNLNEKIKPKRFCFDLDGTLVSFPKINNDYSSVEPIEKNINILRYLKKFGHTIIIYTARRMNTHNGNVGKVLADIGKITFETLDKLNIPYDEIYFGKPLADFYIDDLALNANEDLEKELGFYSSHIEPRSFNSVENLSINLYRKKSQKKLDGEIYYYNNIPSIVKDLFPLMIRYDELNYNWYDMERVNGIPISKIYLGEEMTIELLEVILKSIERLHTINIMSDLNIYQNYKNKLIDRWNTFDYNIFKDSDKIYQQLIEYFEKYEKNNMGEYGMIHGDPVFTNILINQFGKLKLIDMRGKIGDNLSIYGDIYYDYGKIYQSLTGYEEILGNKKINLSYKNKLIDYFEKRMGNKIDKIKMIRKLLILTLIPLHQGENLNDFYNLLY